MRFVWDKNEEYLSQQNKNFVTKFFIRRLLNYIRIWDKVAADRPDYIISNSKYTKERVRKYYGRESEVIYPPACAEASAGKPVEITVKNYFLVVSRLSPYKKIDAVVEAFNKLELPLIIAGEGSQEKYLKKIANKNIKIIGWQSDNEIKKLYQGARAFIFPSVDDFGMTPVEAMGFGVPVIAIRKGGVKETVIEGKTGEFFDAATPEVIADGVRRFMEREKDYDREFIKSRAGEFGRERFTREIREYISKII
jgi:glycosyltransferase involved in cell wall biosynthesis